MCSFLTLHGFWSGFFYLSVSGMLVKQMGNVWFRCWDANRVCNRLGLCWPSKDPSLQFRDCRSGITLLLDAQCHRYFLIVVIAVVTSAAWLATLLSYLFNFLLLSSTCIFTTVYIYWIPLISNAIYHIFIIQLFHNAIVTVPRLPTN